MYIYAPKTQALDASGLSPGVQLSKMLADILLDTTGARQPQPAATQPFRSDFDRADRRP